MLQLQEAGIEPAAFSSIGAPVLMLHGDDDPRPGPATHDTLRRSIEHLEYTGLPRCGHTPWRERHAREPFSQRLREWLATSPD
ncbi:MAG TPA: alpha/beta hydrolase [Chloroflexota bacterium]|nr:alpha/beta hydrolase [Chloroflexota bacterium]